MFTCLGNQLEGAVVVDCGCGPGNLTEKLLERGAARVFAIDLNISMIRQLEARLPEAIQKGQVIAVHARFDGQVFAKLLSSDSSIDGFDVVLFKRSLYVPPREAHTILQGAVASLRPGGKLVVAHVERSLRKYAFRDGSIITSYTPYHLVNRLFSRAGHYLHLGEYRLYTQAELLNLVQNAANGKKVEIIPSKQNSYNMVMVTG
jgi:2-polyprenyl-3-methyl-5-hydroxy-6-metoxy-1,4-benzoquinol methylase